MNNEPFDSYANSEKIMDKLRAKNGWSSPLARSFIELGVVARQAALELGKLHRAGVERWVTERAWRKRYHENLLQWGNRLQAQGSFDSQKARWEYQKEVLLWLPKKIIKLFG